MSSLLVREGSLQENQAELEYVLGSVNASIESLSQDQPLDIPTRTISWYTQYA